MDETSLMTSATEAFVKELGLENDSLLKNKIEIREVPSGTYLMQEESHKVNFLTVCDFILFENL